MKRYVIKATEGGHTEHLNGPWMLHADHARIVAEMEQERFEAAARYADRVAEHAAALSLFSPIAPAAPTVGDTGDALPPDGSLASTSGAGAVSGALAGSPAEVVGVPSNDAHTHTTFERAVSQRHHQECFVDDYDTHSMLCICKRLRRATEQAEQAHAAALAEGQALVQAHITAWEDEYPDDLRALWLAEAMKHRTLTRDGWWPFGSFVDYDFPLEFDGEGDDGLPIWERPDKSRLAPRTLTADDPEPAVRSVALDGQGNVWHRVGDWWWAAGCQTPRSWAWAAQHGPVTLIHDGGVA